MKEKNRIIEKLTGILDILICLLMFISALYKGGFYKEDSLFINMVICMLGLVCLSVKLVLNIRDNKKITKSKIGTLLDACVISMPIAYFMPILFKTYATLEGAIFECLRFINFAIIYFIVRNSKNYKTYLNAIILIGTVLAIFGIDEITNRTLEPFLNNISIYYLDKAYGRISSTLQYANVTALFFLISSIIIESKLVINIPKLKDNNKLLFKIKVSFEIFLLIILQSVIILTTSRMNIFLSILTTIIYAVYLFRNNEKKPGLMLILLEVASIILVTCIDSFLTIQNFLMVILIYIISAILIFVFVYYSNKLKKEYEEKKNKLFECLKSIYKRKSIRIITYLAFAAMLIIIILTPSKLVVSSENSNSISISRNIYLDIKDKINVDLDVSCKEDGNFKIFIYEFDENFTRKQILKLTSKDFKDGKFNNDINVSSDSIKLQFKVKVTDTKLTINSLKIDDKKITLSYLFMPDSIIFRLKDTFNKDSNNSLRYTYYRDGIKLFRLSPFVGLGGEGFKARYQEVQQDSYISSEAHSAFIQTLVESGTLGIIIFTSIHILIYIALFQILKKKDKDGIILLLIFISFNIVSMFDIVFSYGIMINLFGILVGIIIGKYKNNISDWDKYKLDNKSILGMIKIIVLSISLMTLVIVTIYSIKIFNASMIQSIDNDESDINSSYERVGILENKVAKDKYNVSYITNLVTEYDTHIELLNELYLNSNDNETKNRLKGEIDNYITRQKELVDYLIEYEYYNKYAIEKVARCYFKRYISYARIYKSNFKNDEIAYVFYIGYAIKLADRIKEVGPKNETAIKFAYDLYKEFLPDLKMQNKFLGSKMLQEAIDDISNKLQLFKNEIKK